MAIGDLYATRADLYEQLSVSTPSGAMDARLDRLLATASRAIEDHCNRQFNTDGVATPRVFRPAGCRFISVDDFHDSASVIIKSAPSHTAFGTAWSTTDYELEPLNGVVDGVPGRPYTMITLPRWHWLGDDDRVQVTAKWGWATVPKPVNQACLAMAAFLFASAKTPLGVQEFRADGEGISKNKALEAPGVECLLQPYVINTALIG